MQNFIPLVLSKLHIEALFHGNITQEQATVTMETLENILKTSSSSKPLLPSQLKRQREIQLPDGEIIFHCLKILTHWYRNTNRATKKPKENNNIHNRLYIYGQDFNQLPKSKLSVVIDILIFLFYLS